jgi:hypothetical protein
MNLLFTDEAWEEYFYWQETKIVSIAWFMRLKIIQLRLFLVGFIISLALIMQKPGFYLFHPSYLLGKFNAY